MLHFGGVPYAEVKRKQVVFNPACPIQNLQEFWVGCYSFRMVDALPAAVPEHQNHVHTVHVIVRVVLILEVSPLLLALLFICLYKFAVSAFLDWTVPEIESFIDRMRILLQKEGENGSVSSFGGLVLDNFKAIANGQPFQLNQIFS